jgi:hypothetical protein
MAVIHAERVGSLGEFPVPARISVFGSEKGGAGGAAFGGDNADGFRAAHEKVESLIQLDGCVRFHGATLREATLSEHEAAHILPEAWQNLHGCTLLRQAVFEVVAPEISV